MASEKPLQRLDDVVLRPEQEGRASWDKIREMIAIDGVRFLQIAADLFKQTPTRLPRCGRTRIDVQVEADGEPAIWLIALEKAPEFKVGLHIGYH